MGFFSKLFGKKTSQVESLNYQPKTNKNTITIVNQDVSPIEGKQTWEYSEEKKHDLECMKKCCDAELKTMEESGVAPAPYYFERVAILSRKNKNFQQEVDYCELYISALEKFYKNKRKRGIADIRKGPRYQAIVKRLPKAKELLSKSIKTV